MLKFKRLGLLAEFLPQFPKVKPCGATYLLVFCSSGPSVLAYELSSFIGLYVSLLHRHRSRCQNSWLHLRYPKPKCRRAAAIDNAEWRSCLVEGDAGELPFIQQPLLRPRSGNWSRTVDLAASESGSLLMFPRKFCNRW